MGRAEVATQSDLQILVHGIAAGLQTGQQAATAHDAVQLLRLHIMACQEVLDECHTQGHLVNNVLIFGQLIGVVGHILLNQLLSTPVEGQLSAGGAGIDNQL